MRYFLLPALAVSLVLSGCSSSKTSSKKADKATVMTIGTKPVYADEFAYVYNKNNASAENAYSQQSLKEYLELYTNFRLKVAEAESMGLDTTAAFRKELEGYRQQLAQPYLTEKSVTDKLVKEAYERMQKEVNASHILLNLSPEADPKDTLAVYNRAMKLRERALKGEDFGKLARENSEDPSAKDNNGNLGYFTALQMVYPFEDAAYKTPAGQISKPVRTRFGYHLIKVNNVRPAQGEIKVSHIMVRATPGQPAADSIAAKKKIDEIHSLVQKGEDWSKLVSQFSEDAGSASNGGELPWFGTGRMIPSFEEAAFSLKNPGDVSEPIKTPYGWHIIKLQERKSLPAFSEVENSLKVKVAKDSRSELNKTAFVQRVKKENNFQQFDIVVEQALSKADSALLRGTWNYDANAKNLKAPVFVMGGKEYSIGDFYKYVKANQKPRKGGSPAIAMKSMYDKFVEESVTNFEKNQLEAKYTDYRMLINEYRDGILLFQLMDDKVWSRAIEDTAGLRTYFNNNNSKYMWERRAEATVVSAASPEVLNQALEQMKSGRYTHAAGKFGKVQFESGKATLSADAKNALDRLAQAMESDTTLTIELTGNTDSREGTKGKLAQQRATAAADYLASKNIGSNRISTKTNPGKAAKKGETEAMRKDARTVSIKATTGQLTALEESLNQGNPLNVKIHPKKKYQKGENTLVDAVNWQPGTYTIEQDGRHVYVQIHQVEDPKPKKLSEARGVATSDYQQYLEKQWLDELRRKYPVKVNEAEVNKLVKQN